MRTSFLAPVALAFVMFALYTIGRMACLAMLGY